MSDFIDTAVAMCERPAEFFSYSLTDMFSVDPEVMQARHLAVLRKRFADLRDKLPILKAMVASTGVTAIDKFEDVVPLLFHHTVYKAYPPALLSKNRFTDLTRWLNKVTTHDLSGVDVSGCQGIDEWIAVMDRDSPLRICHSSGTTGTVSFLPLEPSDYKRNASYWPVTFLQQFGRPQAYHGVCPRMQFVWFDNRNSSRINGRLADFARDVIAGSEENFHALGGWVSSDMLYLAGKLRAAQAKGNLDSVEVSPALLARKEEFARMKEEDANRLGPFVEKVIKELAGKAAFVSGAMNTIYHIAQDAMEKGHKRVFSPDSVMLLGGGNKGVVLPNNWQESVLEFTGAKFIKFAYAMSEVMGLHPSCEEGHYHLLPSLLPFVLDPDTRAPLPRTGTVTGRMAFFDLGCTNRWGGFVTGDEVTVTWDKPCACGMKGPYTEFDITRYSEKQGGDDKINCAATAKAHEDAVNFLLQL